MTEPVFLAPTVAWHCTNREREPVLAVHIDVGEASSVLTLSYSAAQTLTGRLQHALNKQPRRCVRCELWFLADSPTSAHCSPECFNAAHTPPADA